MIHRPGTPKNRWLIHVPWDEKKRRMWSLEPSILTHLKCSGEFDGNSMGLIGLMFRSPGFLLLQVVLGWWDPVLMSSEDGPSNVDQPGIFSATYLGQPTWQVGSSRGRWVCSQQQKMIRIVKWGFPEMGISKNGWFMNENPIPIKIDDLGVPLFRETTKCPSLTTTHTHTFLDSKSCLGSSIPSYPRSDC